MEAKIRKQQSILMCSGLAMILFGIWSIVRVVLMRFIEPVHFASYFAELTEPVDTAYLNLILVIALILLFIDLSIRSYVGISAIKDGTGRGNSKITYIIVAILCLVVAVGSDVASIIALINDQFDFEIFLATVVDISIHIATLEVIVAAIKIRKLTREAKALLV